MDGREGMKRKGKKMRKRASIGGKVGRRRNEGREATGRSVGKA